MSHASKEPQRIYDLLRKKWLKSTPEELVRQNLIQWMVQSKGYPLALLSTEKKISSCHRRFDIACFKPNPKIGDAHSILLLIECKANPLKREDLHQLYGYNHQIKAPCLSLCSPKGIYYSYNSCNQWKAGLPSYQELLKHLDF